MTVREASLLRSEQFCPYLLLLTCISGGIGNVTGFSVHEDVMTSFQVNIYVYLVIPVYGLSCNLEHRCLYNNIGFYCTQYMEICKRLFEFLV